MQRMVLILTLLSGAALAHSGATGVVKERMDAMSEIAEAVKTLGGMAKSGDLDAAQVQSAADFVARAAREIPTKFAERDLSKPSESLPAIWQDFDDFTAKAEVLAATATALPAATNIDDFRAAFAQLGKACSACHEIYRQPQ